MWMWTKASKLTQKNSQKRPRQQVTTNNDIIDRSRRSKFGRCHVKCIRLTRYEKSIRSIKWLESRSCWFRKYPRQMLLPIIITCRNNQSCFSIHLVLSCFPAVGNVLHASSLDCPLPFLLAFLCLYSPLLVLFFTMFFFHSLFFYHMSSACWISSFYSFNPFNCSWTNDIYLNKKIKQSAIKLQQSPLNVVAHQYHIIKKNVRHSCFISVKLANSFMPLALLHDNRFFLAFFFLQL